MPAVVPTPLPDEPDRYSFPDGFLWGTATAGYQVEGNSTTADLWAWEHAPDSPLKGERSGPACDWWDGQRWREDFDRAAADHHSALRLSIEWSRVEPRPGQWDEAALAHYGQMLAGLRERGLRPLVTLHHFANPAWLTERRGWETGEAVGGFERFARKVVETVGKHTDLWCTLNEPNVYPLAGWGAGIFPPRKQSLRLLFRVTANLLRAHAAAYRVIHAAQPDAQVGLAVHFRPFYPARPNHWLDELLTRVYFNYFSSLFPEALGTGRMRRLGAPSLHLPEVMGTRDYFGLNYYTGDLVRFDLARWRELFGRRSFPAGAIPDDLGFYAVYPQGLQWSLNWIKASGLPVYITENGIGDATDRLRPSHLVAHLHEVWKAIYQAGCEVRGYFHWTLVDNFEWERGWRHRFGLYQLDPVSQTRAARPSARLYAEICQANGLTREQLATFAPGSVRRGA